MDDRLRKVVTELGDIETAIQSVDSLRQKIEYIKVETAELKHLSDFLR
jgi:hypothetical protein